MDIRRERASRALTAPPAIGGPGLRASVDFPAALESEYRRKRLQGQVALIRITCVIGAVLAGLRSIDLLANGHAGWPTAFIPIVVISVLLLVAACMPGWERLYLPVANVLVPVRNACIAFGSALAARHGQPELLMVLPLAIVGPFFFLGLGYRAAGMTSVLTVAVFIGTAVMAELPMPMSIRVSVCALATLLGCLIAAKQLDGWARRAYLEGHMIVELAEQDGLTGLKNRRVFDEALDLLWRRAIDEQRTLAMLLIDVDRFKAFNDCYGHQAGDHALVEVARALERIVTHPSDVLARYGGEEFAAILYGADAERGFEIAERLRTEIAAMSLAHEESALGVVTISIGVAHVEPTPERRPQGAVQLADEALYQAKLKGRNRVELLDPVAHGLMITGVFANAAFRRAEC